MMEARNMPPTMLDGMSVPFRVRVSARSAAGTSAATVCWPEGCAATARAIASLVSTRRGAVRVNIVAGTSIVVTPNGVSAPNVARLMLSYGMRGCPNGGT